MLNNSLKRNYILVLFDPQIGPYQMLPLRDQGGSESDGTIAVLGISPKAPDSLKPHHQIA